MCNKCINQELIRNNIKKHMEPMKKYYPFLFHLVISKIVAVNPEAVLINKDVIRNLT